MNTLSISRYLFTFEVTEPLHLPDYAGSALRGAFGHALIQLSGISKSDIEQKNSLFLQSPYAQIFDPQMDQHDTRSVKGLQQLPVPYVIEAPLTGAKSYAPGDILEFHLVLTGSALTQLAIIILAWRRAFLRGIGLGDGRAELLQVTQTLPGSSSRVIYHAEQPIIIDHKTELTIPQFKHNQDVHLHLQTPMRLQQRGKILGPRESNASQLLRQLIRRVTLHTQLHNQWEWPLENIRTLNDLADTVQDDRRLHWQEWGRYSSRQQQAMKLGGVVGRWYLQQVPVELLPLIYLGQWLHLGKETAFGLGKYDWVAEAWRSDSNTMFEEAETAHV